MKPFGEWLPDLPALDNPGALEAKNVIPKTPGSYGPLPDLTNQSTAGLSATAIGGYAARKANGDGKMFGADASALYTLSDAVPTDVSKTGGYTTAALGYWEFAQYKEKVIATNYSDPVQVFDVDAGSAFSDLATAAPKARHLSIIRDFVVLGNTNDTVDGDRPERVWWSAAGDATSWPTIGSQTAAQLQSDYQDLPNGGWVQRIVGSVGGADGLVIQEHAIWRMSYEGPPTVFRFDPIERARGTPAPNSCVNVGAFMAYLGEDGFYLNDGSQSIPIGSNKIDKAFYAEVDQSQMHRVWGAYDPLNKLIFWAYPTATGSPDKVIIYNWDIQKWSHGEIESEILFPILSDGYTLEELDAFGTLETLPFSMDSQTWVGGRFAFGGFDHSHRLASFSGANLAATIDTGEWGTDQRQFLSGIRPLVDGGTATVRIGYREGPGDSVTFSGESSVDDDGEAHFRVSSRYARARVKVAAGGSWTHAQGVNATGTTDGKR